MTTIYSHILCATDLGPQSLYIGQQALDLATLCQAELLLLHVIEPPILYTADFSKSEQNLKQSKSAALRSLHALGLKLGVSESHVFSLVGNPQNEILRFSHNKNCDLIVVGSQGIGGYTHGLGSTAHNLLSQSSCNVLIIQVQHLRQTIETFEPLGDYLWEIPFNVDHQATQYGSKHGFGEDIKRGPRPGNRPPKSPYRGGTRSEDSEDDRK